MLASVSLSLLFISVMAEMPPPILVTSENKSTLEIARRSLTIDYFVLLPFFKQDLGVRSYKREAFIEFPFF